MTEILKSASFPHGLPAMGTEAEARARLSMVDVINRGADPQTMSDDQLATEYRCQRRLAAAINEMRLALSEASAVSSVMSIDRTGFDDYLHDASLLSFRHWDEMIAQARRG